jgi:hypothetical protein
MCLYAHKWLSAWRCRHEKDEEALQREEEPLFGEAEDRLAC